MTNNIYKQFIEETGQVLRFTAWNKHRKNRRCCICNSKKIYAQDGVTKDWYCFECWGKP